jgi:hypothetical protein
MTSSQPVLLACDDGSDYVVKGQQAGRMIVTDQVVGRLGGAVLAPVAEITLIDVPAELINAEPEMSHMRPGVSHGSRWLANCSDSKGFEQTTVPENRDRFARLALLYGWVIASDHQFIYENAEPRLVHSVDHGHFLAGATNWTEETLRHAPAPAPDNNVVAACSLTTEELDRPAADMRIDDEAIAVAVVARQGESARRSGSR